VARRDPGAQQALAQTLELMSWHGWLPPKLAKRLA
jgi:hypothetical protein